MSRDEGKKRQSVGTIDPQIQRLYTADNKCVSF